MSLKVKDIINIMEAYAPTYLKEDYDNVGLMVGDRESSVTSILVALDCTLKVIEEAKKNNCNLILTHHPIIFKKPSSLTTDSLLGKKIIELIKNDIAVYSSHTNLDVVSGGINDLIVKVLGYNSEAIIDKSPFYVEGSKEYGIGRLITLDAPMKLSDLCDKVKKNLELSSLRYSGSDNKEIKKIAVINGSGSSYMGKAKSLGADCIITGDTTYHYVSDFLEENIAIIDAGHFATEWPAMVVFAEILKNNLISLGFSTPIIISNEIHDPYKYR